MKELSTSVGLRVSGLFVIMAVSLIGALIPLHSSNGSTATDLGKSPFFLTMRMFAAGIMLGVAFIHLLADANNNLVTVCPEYESLSMALATAGCILVLSVEQGTLYLMGRASSSPRIVVDKELHTMSGDLTSDPRLKQGDIYHGGNDCTCKPLVSSGPSHYHCGEHHHHDDGHIHDHDHEHALDVSEEYDTPHGMPLNVMGHTMSCAAVHSSHTNLEPQTDTTSCSYDHDHGHSHAHTLTLAGEGETIDIKKLTVKAFIMEIAIATHSIIIGVAFGALGEGSLETLRALFAALSFHQFFEGIALGTAIASVKNVLGWYKVASFVFIFALTTPVGICIGMLAVPSDSEPSVNQQFAQGVLNALAAGNLVYIVLVEMVAECMNATFLINKPSLRALMLTALILGDLCMAILAIWA